MALQRLRKTARAGQVVRMSREDDEVGLEQYMCSFNTQVGV